MKDISCMLSKNIKDKYVNVMFKFLLITISIYTNTFKACLLVLPHHISPYTHQSHNIIHHNNSSMSIIKPSTISSHPWHSCDEIAKSGSRKFYRCHSPAGKVFRESLWDSLRLFCIKVSLPSAEKVTSTPAFQTRPSRTTGIENASSTNRCASAKEYIEDTLHPRQPNNTLLSTR